MLLGFNVKKRKDMKKNSLSFYLVYFIEKGNKEINKERNRKKVKEKLQ